MLRILLLMTYLCMLPVFVFADTAGSKIGPKGYLPQDVFEFEPVLEGTQVVHDFILYNKGDEPLQILKVKSG